MTNSVSFSVVLGTTAVTAYPGRCRLSMG